MSWKFNPPPGWAVPADADWVPPPGWAPDPSWPPPPPGWEFWVRREPDYPPAPAGPSGFPPPPQPVPPQPATPQPVPPQPATPPSRAGSSRGRPWLVAAVTLAVVLPIVCTGGVVAVVNWDRISSLAGSSPEPTPRAALASWDDCDRNPNTCNSGEGADGGELVWGVNGADSWHRHTMPGSSPTTHQVMSGIAPSTGTFLPDGTWQWNLDLLAREPVQTGSNPDTYQYEIRPEAVWSDGTGITADDFAFLWRHNAGDGDLCDGCAAATTRGYERIAEVAGSDGGKTVTVTFREGESHPEWWSLFTYLYPAHLAQAQGFDLETAGGVREASEWFSDTVPDWSGGPWQITTGDLLDEVVLERNPEWYGEAGPALDRIVFQVIIGEEELWNATLAGQVDGFGPLPDPGLSAVAGVDGVLGHTGSGYAWDHLDVNVTREWMDDVALRQAIFTVVDVETIIELAYVDPAPDTQPKRNHLFPPDSPYHQDHLSGTGQGTGNVEQARALLEEAGYEFQDGVLTSDGEQVGPLRLMTSQGNPRREMAVEVIADQLAEIGIEVEIDTDLLFQILDEDRDYDLVLFGWTGSPLFAEDGYQFWHSESPSNFGSYANDQVDSLVLDAAYAADQDEAAALLNDAMALLVEDAYMLPIAHTPQLTAMWPRFHNIRPHPGNDLFANSHEWGQLPG